MSDFLLDLRPQGLRTLNRAAEALQFAEETSFVIDRPAFGWSSHRRETQRSGPHIAQIRAPSWLSRAVLCSMRLSGTGHERFQGAAVLPLGSSTVVFRSWCRSP